MNNWPIDKRIYKEYKKLRIAVKQFWNKALSIEEMDALEAEHTWVQALKDGMEAADNGTKNS